MSASRLCPSLCQTSLAAALAAAFLLSCSGGPSARPNIILIVWDTVRADRLSLYGFDKPTTPFLDEWAKGARVYDDCVSPANYTVSSHASLFTGLLPTEHGVRNGSSSLPASHTTLAELLGGAGYQTFFYSANPRLSRETGFAQGFDVAEHPWSEKLQAEAYQIVRRKILPKSRSSELDFRVRAGMAGPWEVKASGELAGRTVIRWLRRIDRKKPFFIFLNYMEAHKPRIPPESYRRRFLPPELVERSYRVDTRWTAVWAYNYGLREYSDDELAAMEGTYEAAVAELDDLHRELVRKLDTEGFLKNTILVLTSDHGEHLGEEHLLGHEHSLHEPLVRVPLVILDPKRFAPGREKRPVMTQDLFETLLELSGVAAPSTATGCEASLLRPVENRARLSECLGVFDDAFPDIFASYPAWDPGPWKREIRAITLGGNKLIRWSDGETRLYRVADDPDERHDLAAREPEAAGALGRALGAIVASLPAAVPSEEPKPVLSEEQREMLRALGYLYDGADSSGNRRE